MVTLKRNLVFLLLIVSITIIAGCTSTGQTTADEPQKTPTTTQTTPNVTTPTQNQQSCKNVQEAYIEQVPYTEQESYTVQVAYTEQEPYQEQESYTYYLQRDASIFKASSEWELGGRGTYAQVLVDVKNLDNEAGWFNVIVEFETLKDGKTKLSQRHYIEPDKTIRFDLEYDIDAGEDWQYNVASVQSDPIAKTRVVTKYRDVTRYRDEIRYRDVTKYRTETKYKTVTKCE